LPVKSRTTAVTKDAVGAVNSIHAVQRDAARVKAEDLQSAIFRNVNFLYIATDEKGVIQLFNAGAERMLGYTASEVVGKITPAELSDPQELIARAKALSLEFDTLIAPGFEALVFKASRGIEDVYELTRVRKDGSKYPAIASVTALRNDLDAIIGYLLISTDNTARKRVERELLESNIELQKARAAAEKANLAKSDFLSSMSHELRSPLHTILGFAQLIDGDDPPPTLAQAASVEQILKAGWYLLELINEILDLSLIESGKLAISTEPTSLTEVLRECRAMIVPQGRKRRIQVSFPETGIPYFVDADRTRLKQILINLLSNAIKYGQANGSVVVDCAMSTSASTPKRVRVSISDTGAGLSPETLLQLFQPFNRFGQERTEEEGTGIGLAMSKRLVEMMGGAIGVESTVGSGSVFWFELNSAASPQAGVDTEPAAIADARVQHGPPLLTLLYVEDNPANMQLIEQIMKSRRPDIRLLCAGDGNEGIRLARANQPDVILMDINLPGMSGIEALGILRQDPVTAPIPVVALSASAMPRDIKKGLDEGFFRYLTKPIKVKALLDMLDEALEFGVLPTV
jgi:signal transduction histidine kinase/ActR/RegA family two-component response regulator